jgi:hypothetical protein
MRLLRVVAAVALLSGVAPSPSIAQDEPPAPSEQLNAWLLEMSEGLEMLRALVLDPTIETLAQAAELTDETLRQLYPWLGGWQRLVQDARFVSAVTGDRPATILLRILPETPSETLLAASDLAGLDGNPGAPGIYFLAVAGRWGRGKTFQVARLSDEFLEIGLNGREGAALRRLAQLDRERGPLFGQYHVVEIQPNGATFRVNQTAGHVARRLAERGGQFGMMDEAVARPALVLEMRRPNGFIEHQVRFTRDGHAFVFLPQRNAVMTYLGPPQLLYPKYRRPWEVFRRFVRRMPASAD